MCKLCYSNEGESKVNDEPDKNSDSEPIHEHCDVEHLPQNFIMDVEDDELLNQSIDDNLCTNIDLDRETIKIFPRKNKKGKYAENPPKKGQKYMASREYNGKRTVFIFRGENHFECPTCHKTFTTVAQVRKCNHKSRKVFQKEPYSGQQAVYNLVQKLGSSFEDKQRAHEKMKSLGRNAEIKIYCASTNQRHLVTVKVNNLLNRERIPCDTINCSNFNTTIPLSERYEWVQHILNSFHIKLIDTNEEFVKGTTALIEKKKGKRGSITEKAGGLYMPRVMCLSPNCSCDGEIVTTTTLSSLLQGTIGCSARRNIPYSERWNEVLQMKIAKQIDLEIRTEIEWKTIFDCNKNAGEIRVNVACQKTARCREQYVSVSVHRLFNRDRFWCLCSEKKPPYDSEDGYIALTEHAKLINCVPVNTMNVYLERIRMFEGVSNKFTPRLKCLNADCPEPYFENTTINAIQQGNSGCGCSRSMYERRAKIILDEIFSMEAKTTHPEWLTYNIGKCPDCGRFHNAPLQLDLDYHPYNFACEVNGHPGHDGKIWKQNEGRVQCTLKKDMFKVDKCKEVGKIFLVLSSKYIHYPPAKLKPVIVAKVHELIPDLDEQVSRLSKQLIPLQRHEARSLKRVSYVEFLRDFYTGKVTQIDSWEKQYIPAFDKEITFSQSFGNSKELRSIVNKIRQGRSIPQNYREYLDHGYFLWDTKNLARHVMRRFQIKLADLPDNLPDDICEHLENLRSQLKQTGHWKYFGGVQGHDIRRPSYFRERYQKDVKKLRKQI